MKNTYIIALKKGNEPLLIKQVPMEDICYIGKNYKNAYIFETKEKAEETRKKRYKTREERKNDKKYPDFY